MRFAGSVKALVAPLIASALLTAFTSVPALARVELNFWDMNWGGPEYSTVAADLVEKFNQSQADIHVTYRSISWANWYETFVTAIASGSAPDISTGGGFQAVQLYDLGAIEPIDDLVKEFETDGTATDFVEDSLDAMKFDGHYVTLPWAVEVRPIFYRKDVLKNADVDVPKTWGELLVAAKTIGAQPGMSGIATSGDALGMHWALTLMINNDAGLFNAKREPDLTGPKSKEAIEFLGKLAEAGAINKTAAGYTNDDAKGLFYAGKAGFLLGSPMTADGDPSQKSNIGVLPPIKSPSGTTGTIRFVNNIMVYSQSKHLPETKAFLRWLSSNEGTLFTKGHASGLPARKSLQADTYFTQNEQLAYIIKNYLPISKPLSATAGGTFPALNEIDGDGFLTSMIQAIWQGQAVEGVLASAQAHLKEIMEK